MQLQPVTLHPDAAARVELLPAQNGLAQPRTRIRRCQDRLQLRRATVRLADLRDPPVGPWRHWSSPRPATSIACVHPHQPLPDRTVVPGPQHRARRVRIARRPVAHARFAAPTFCGIPACSWTLCRPRMQPRPPRSADRPHPERHRADPPAHSIREILVMQAAVVAPFFPHQAGLRVEDRPVGLDPRSAASG